MPSFAGCIGMVLTLLDLGVHINSSSKLVSSSINFPITTQFNEGEIKPIEASRWLKKKEVFRMLLMYGAEWTEKSEAKAPARYEEDLDMYELVHCHTAMASEVSLKSRCRLVIRETLVNRNGSMKNVVHLLGLPKLMTDYLLYNYKVHSVPCLKPK